jgi:hypothetical protein
MAGDRDRGGQPGIKGRNATQKKPCRVGWQAKFSPNRAQLWPLLPEDKPRVSLGFRAYFVRRIFSS